MSATSATGSPYLRGFRAWGFSGRALGFRGGFLGPAQARSRSEGLDSIFGLWDLGGVWGFRGLGFRV